MTDEPQPHEDHTHADDPAHGGGEADSSGLSGHMAAPEMPQAPPLPDETAWICQMLGVQAADWATIVSVAQPIPGYEAGAALLALEQVESAVDRGVFDQGYVTTLRLIDLSTGDEVHSVPALGSHCAFTVDRQVQDPTIDIDDPQNHHPVVVGRIEQDMAQGGESRLVTFGVDETTARAGQDVIWALIRGRCSPWRRRSVVFDPTPAGLVRSLPPTAPAAAVQPPDAARLELERSVLAPLRGDGDPTQMAANVIVSGPTGAGKSGLIGWLTAELEGLVTTIVVPARVLASPDLIHLLYEMAADDGPSLVVLDHLDLLLGDRYSMRYPESLAELIAQLDDLVGPRGPVTVATVTTTDPLDSVLLGRFRRTIELGAAGSTERRQAIEAMIKEFDADESLIETLVKRTAGWNPRQVAELERLAATATTDGDDADLVALAHRVDEPVRATGSPSDDGSYL